MYYMLLGCILLGSQINYRVSFRTITVLIEPHEIETSRKRKAHAESSIDG